MRKPIFCSFIISLICLFNLLFLFSCAHKFKVFNETGQVIREIESHWDQITYEEMSNGCIKMTAGDNRTAWEFIFPALVQKTPELQIHTGENGD